MTFLATYRRAFLILLLPLLFTACDSNNNDEPQELPEPRVVAEGDFTVADNGLKYFDFTVGDGTVATSGDQVVVDYNGWLEDGRLFDSSYLRGRPIAFTLGQGQVIPGFEQGLDSMRVGGERQIVLPPDLAYGSSGSGSIPPNATLIFEVELVDINTATATPQR